MVDNRLRTEGSVPELSRRDGGGGVGARPSRVGPATPVHRDRIPTLRQLAGLVVNGILTLPRNYRRGMFLDILT
jgi:hypothetical protein